jgi:N-acylglucosamine-6-phosphate 2-epimerase
MATNDPFAALRGGLIVSVQTSSTNPLHGDEHVVALARAAQLGGAAAVRVDTPRQIELVRAATDLPLIGIDTRVFPDSDVQVTPTFACAQAVVEAGAEIVSIDGTDRPRPGGERFADTVRRVHEELGVPVIADVSTLEQGIAAREAGADAIGSAVEGYEGFGSREPDIALIAKLAERLDCPILAERYFTTIEQVTAAMEAGAHAVIMGSAIVDPTIVVRRFADTIRAASAPAAG